MLNRVTYLIVAALALSACNPIAAPTAESTFQIKVKANLQNDQDLLDQFKMEDKALLYISGGTYNCGDVATEQANEKAVEAAGNLQKELNDPNSIIEKEFKFLDKYQEALNSVASDAKRIQTYLSAVTSALATFVGTKVAASLADGAIKEASGPFQDAALLAIANTYKDQLDSTVEDLETRFVIPINADQAYYFKLWNECELDKFAYLREVQLKVGPYRPVGFAPSTYPALTAQSTGTELDKAFVDYLTARNAQLKMDGSMKAALDAIKKANDDLANPKTIESSLLAGGPSSSAASAGSSGQPGNAGSNAASPPGQGNASQVCQAVAEALKLAGLHAPACASSAAAAAPSAASTAPHPGTAAPHTAVPHATATLPL